MQVDALAIGLVIAGIVVVIALFRFRHVIARLTVGSSGFSLGAKNEDLAGKGSTRIKVGDVEGGSLDVVGGSRGSVSSVSGELEVNIHVGNVKGSNVAVTGKDHVQGKQS